MIFVDEARIYVRAGRGGHGVKSFRAKKKGRLVYPDGGRGGNGGNVIIKASKDVPTLFSFKHQRQFRAASGAQGRGGNKNGSNGKDLLIIVPCGTVIYENKTNFLLRDFEKKEGSVLIARGGRGGGGNSRTKQAAAGTAGEEKDLYLDLRLVVEVGVISLPNAGKSTFLSRISGAKPKVARFPFTTKIPVLGVVKREDFDFLAVEIPALTLGSHENRGLGNKFLKHLQHTKLLIQLIDMSASDGRDPIEDYYLLNEELKLYDHGLVAKPQILIANKMDLPGADIHLRRFKAKVSKEIFCLSALNGEDADIETFLNYVEEQLK